MSLDPNEYVAESGGINARLFNPLSSMDRSGVDKYPEFFSHLFPNNARAGWLAGKMTAAALLGAVIFGTLRMTKGLVEASEEDKDSDPAKKMRHQVGTTYRYGQAKHAAAVPRPGMLSVVDSAGNVALPTLALLLLGTGVYTGIDKLADKLWTRKTEKALAKNDATLQKLIETRARLANGNATAEEVEKVLNDTEDYGYVKHAGFRPSSAVSSLATALGLLTAGVGLLTGIGAYKYFKDTNAENIKYKAMKRGLLEFARRKAEMTPLALSPDTDMLARIDERKDDEKDKKEDIRKQTEISDANRPVAITLD